jgi:hypothetical protein
VKTGRTRPDGNSGHETRKTGVKEAHIHLFNQEVAEKATSKMVVGTKFSGDHTPLAA